MRTRARWAMVVGYRSPTSTLDPVTPSPRPAGLTCAYKYPVGLFGSGLWHVGSLVAFLGGQPSERSESRAAVGWGWKRRTFGSGVGGGRGFLLVPHRTTRTRCMGCVRFGLAVVVGRIPPAFGADPVRVTSSRGGSDRPECCRADPVGGWSLGVPVAGALTVEDVAEFTPVWAGLARDSCFWCCDLGMLRLPRLKMCGGSARSGPAFRA